MVSVVTSPDKIGENWKKSSYSHMTGNCVEVDGMPGSGVRIRDSQNPGGSILLFSPGPWSAFVSGVRSGNRIRG